MDKHSVMISYATEDLALATQVVQILQAKEVSCWYAFANIKKTESWPAAISKAIDSCDVLVLILTTNSNISKQVIREVTLADQRGKRLYCFQTENVNISDDLSYFFSGIQRHEAFNADLISSINEMTKDILSFVKTVKDTTQQMSSASEQNIKAEMSVQGREAAGEEKQTEWKTATSEENNQQEQAEPTGAGKTIEDILNELGKNAKKARSGANSWVVKEGSAEIKIRYNTANYFIAADAYLCRLPKDEKQMKSVLRFLLQENYKASSQVLSCTKEEIILSCIMYDLDMTKEAGIESFRNLFEKADEYDDLLQKGWGCPALQ